MARLADKYPGAALITGASAGLGDAFARRCASEGMDVVLVARRRDRLDALAAEIQKAHKVKAHVVAVDLSTPDAANQIKQACDAAGVTVSMLINNAGFGSHGFYQDTDPAWQLNMVDVNCRAPVALTNVFLPGMIARKNGAVIFLASTAAYQPTPFFAVYGATKSFNLMLGEALWSEMKPFGVDALAVSPGYTTTEFQDVADIKTLPPKALWRKPEDVINSCFGALGKQPSVIDGGKNAMGAWALRFATRTQVAKIAYKVLKPKA